MRPNGRGWRAWRGTVAEFTKEEGELVGAIRPGPNGEPPLFRIIRHDDEVRDAGPNVRPCDHRQFIVDAKFSTVTCGKCHTQVPPCAALIILIEHWDRVICDRQTAADAEKRAHVAELRRLGRLRCMTDEERAEIATAVNSYRLTHHDAALLASRFRKVESARRQERRVVRRKAAHVEGTR